MFECVNDIQTREDCREDTSSMQNEKFDKVHVKVETLAHDTCRICLKKGRLAIFGANAPGVLCGSIYEISGVLVTCDDSYPKCLCQSCYTLLQGAILFKKTALKSERILKKLDPISNDDINDEADKKIAVIEQLNKQKWFADTTPKEKLLKKIKPEPNSEIEDADVFPDDENALGAKNKKTNKECEWIIKCFTCETKFYNFTDFTKHGKDCRNIALACAICNMRFNKYRDFADHKRSEHEKKISYKKSSKRPESSKPTKPCKEKAPYVCDICGKTFATKGFFTQHRPVHFNEKPFKCPMCTYRCKFKASLIRHQLIHSNDLPFKCSLCPYRTRLKSSLTMHMRSHTGEKPYQCELCPSRFGSKSNLSQHTRRHKEHSFCCEVCSKGYHTKRELEIHIKDDHTDGKRHLCRFCEKSFAHRRAMMKHERNVHKRQNLVRGIMPIYLKLETMKQQNEVLSNAIQQNDDVQSET